MTDVREAKQVALDKAFARLSDALERIVDGLDNIPSDVEPSGPHVEEIETLRNRVSDLENEIEMLRTAGRTAADGIGETIAVLEAARR